VAPQADDLQGADDAPLAPVPEDPAVASASPVPGADAAPRRMTDDRT